MRANVQVLTKKGEALKSIVAMVHLLFAFYSMLAPNNPLIDTGTGKVPSALISASGAY